ncbi:uncharacterized protein MONBRDRAFT_38958 [Monosiga brevicollis MX1]|uniref:Uncharacterized protein n=1 Tax=Monosiga brevicollis TaxID=81824 RepID=A9VB63_MONBE|nr:uncharacterized protein MONBRDRAFT_38958 [Monosiga brevicollis MX1]EDQ85132.1 predicted protein [Monosiga brevicollis MX1]|eukprot:XP_001749957.1 hypothetical protein [Monosiga brevicollis MX1]
MTELPSAINTSHNICHTTLIQEYLLDREQWLPIAQSLCKWVQERVVAEPTLAAALGESGAHSQSKAVGKRLWQRHLLPVRWRCCALALQPNCPPCVSQLASKQADTGDALRELKHIAGQMEQIASWLEGLAWVAIAHTKSRSSDQLLQIWDTFQEMLVPTADEINFEFALAVLFQNQLPALSNALLRSNDLVKDLNTLKSNLKKRNDRKLSLKKPLQNDRAKIILQVAMVPFREFSTDTDMRANLDCYDGTPQDLKTVSLTINQPLSSKPARPTRSEALLQSNIICRIEGPSVKMVGGDTLQVIQYVLPLDIQLCLVDCDQSYFADFRSHLFATNPNDLWLLQRNSKLTEDPQATDLDTWYTPQKAIEDCGASRLVFKINNQTFEYNRNTLCFLPLDGSAFDSHEFLRVAPTRAHCQLNGIVRPVLVLGMQVNCGRRRASNLSELEQLRIQQDKMIGTGNLQTISVDAEVLTVALFAYFYCWDKLPRNGFDRLRHHPLIADFNAPAMRQALQQLTNKSGFVLDSSYWNERLCLEANARAQPAEQVLRQLLSEESHYELNLIAVLSPKLFDEVQRLCLQGSGGDRHSMWRPTILRFNVDRSNLEAVKQKLFGLAASFLLTIAVVQLSSQLAANDILWLLAPFASPACSIRFILLDTCLHLEELETSDIGQYLFYGETRPETKAPRLTLLGAESQVEQAMLKAPVVTEPLCEQAWCDLKDQCAKARQWIPEALDAFANKRMVFFVHPDRDTCINASRQLCQEMENKERTRLETSMSTSRDSEGHESDSKPICTLLKELNATASDFFQSVSAIIRNRAKQSGHARVQPVVAVSSANILQPQTLKALLSEANDNGVCLAFFFSSLDPQILMTARDVLSIDPRVLNYSRGFSALSVLGWPEALVDSNACRQAWFLSVLFGSRFSWNMLNAVAKKNGVPVPLPHRASAREHRLIDAINALNAPDDEQKDLLQQLVARLHDGWCDLWGEGQDQAKSQPSLELVFANPAWQLSCPGHAVRKWISCAFGIKMDEVQRKFGLVPDVLQTTAPDLLCFAADEKVNAKSPPALFQYNVKRRSPRQSLTEYLMRAAMLGYALDWRALPAAFTEHTMSTQTFLTILTSSAQPIVLLCAISPAILDTQLQGASRVMLRRLYSWLAPTESEFSLLKLAQFYIEQGSDSAQPGLAQLAILLLHACKDNNPSLISTRVVELLMKHHISLRVTADKVLPVLNILLRLDGPPNALLQQQELLAVVETCRPRDLDGAFEELAGREKNASIGRVLSDTLRAPTLPPGSVLRKTRLAKVLSGMCGASVLQASAELVEMGLRLSDGLLAALFEDVCRHHSTQSVAATFSLLLKLESAVDPLTRLLQVLNASHQLPDGQLLLDVLQNVRPKDNTWDNTNLQHHRYERELQLLFALIGAEPHAAARNMIALLEKESVASDDLKQAWRSKKSQRVIPLELDELSSIREELVSALAICHVDGLASLVLTLERFTGSRGLASILRTTANMLKRPQPNTVQLQQLYLGLWMCIPTEHCEVDPAAQQEGLQMKPGAFDQLLKWAQHDSLGLYQRSKTMSGLSQLAQWLYWPETLPLVSLLSIEERFRPVSRREAKQRSFSLAQAASSERQLYTTVAPQYVDMNPALNESLQAVKVLLQGYTQRPPYPSIVYLVDCGHNKDICVYNLAAMAMLHSKCLRPRSLEETDEDKKNVAANLAYIHNLLGVWFALGRISHQDLQSHLRGLLEEDYEAFAPLANYQAEPCRVAVPSCIDVHHTDSAVLVELLSPNPQPVDRRSTIEVLNLFGGPFSVADVEKSNDLEKFLQIAEDRMLAGLNDATPVSSKAAAYALAMRLFWGRSEGYSRSASRASVCRVFQKVAQNRYHRHFFRHFLRTLGFNAQAFDVDSSSKSAALQIATHLASTLIDLEDPFPVCAATLRELVAFVEGHGMLSSDEIKRLKNLRNEPVDEPKVPPLEYTTPACESEIAKLLEHRHLCSRQADGLASEPHQGVASRKANPLNVIPWSDGGAFDSPSRKFGSLPGDNGRQGLISFSLQSQEGVVVRAPALFRMQQIFASKDDPNKACSVLGIEILQGPGGVLVAQDVTVGGLLVASSTLVFLDKRHLNAKEGIPSGYKPVQAFPSHAAAFSFFIEDAPASTLLVGENVMLKRVSGGNWHPVFTHNSRDSLPAALKPSLSAPTRRLLNDFGLAQEFVEFVAQLVELSRSLPGQDAETRHQIADALQKCEDTGSIAPLEQLTKRHFSGENDGLQRLLQQNLRHQKTCFEVLMTPGLHDNFDIINFLLRGLPSLPERNEGQFAFMPAKPEDIVEKSEDAVNQDDYLLFDLPSNSSRASSAAAVGSEEFVYVSSDSEDVEESRASSALSLFDADEEAFTRNTSVNSMEEPWPARSVWQVYPHQRLSAEFERASDSLQGNFFGFIVDSPMNYTSHDMNWIVQCARAPLAPNLRDWILKTFLDQSFLQCAPELQTNARISEHIVAYSLAERCPIPNVAKRLMAAFALPHPLNKYFGHVSGEFGIYICDPPVYQQLHNVLHIPMRTVDVEVLRTRGVIGEDQLLLEILGQFKDNITLVYVRGMDTIPDLLLKWCAEYTKSVAYHYIYLESTNTTKNFVENRDRCNTSLYHPPSLQELELAAISQPGMTSPQGATNIALATFAPQLDISFSDASSLESHHACDFQKMPNTTLKGSWKRKMLTWLGLSKAQTAEESQAVSSGQLSAFVVFSPPGAGKTHFLDKVVRPQWETVARREVRDFDCSSKQLVEESLASVLSSRCSGAAKELLVVADEFHMLNKAQKLELFATLAERALSQPLRVILIGNRREKDDDDLLAAWKAMPASGNIQDVSARLTVVELHARIVQLGLNENKLLCWYACCRALFSDHVLTLRNVEAAVKCRAEPAKLAHLLFSKMPSLGQLASRCITEAIFSYVEQFALGWKKEDRDTPASVGLLRLLQERDDDPLRLLARVGLASASFTSQARAHARVENTEVANSILNSDGSVEMLESDETVLMSYPEFADAFPGSHKMHPVLRLRTWIGYIQYRLSEELETKIELDCTSLRRLVLIDQPGFPLITGVLAMQGQPNLSECRAWSETGDYTDLEWIRVSLQRNLAIDWQRARDIWSTYFVTDCVAFLNLLDEAPNKAVVLSAVAPMNLAALLLSSRHAKHGQQLADLVVTMMCKDESAEHTQGNLGDCLDPLFLSQWLTFTLRTPNLLTKLVPQQRRRLLMWAAQHLTKDLSSTLNSECNAALLAALEEETFQLMEQADFDAVRLLWSNHFASHFPIRTFTAVQSCDAHFVVADQPSAHSAWPEELGCLHRILHGQVELQDLNLLASCLASQENTTIAGFPHESSLHRRFVQSLVSETVVDPLPAAWQRALVAQVAEPWMRDEDLAKVLRDKEYVTCKLLAGFLTVQRAADIFPKWDRRLKSCAVVREHFVQLFGVDDLLERQGHLKTLHEQAVRSEEQRQKEKMKHIRRVLPHVAERPQILRFFTDQVGRTALAQLLHQGKAEEFDEFRNPRTSNFDLARDGAFNQQKILIGNFFRDCLHQANVKIPSGTQDRVRALLKNGGFDDDEFSVGSDFVRIITPYQSLSRVEQDARLQRLLAVLQQGQIPSSVTSVKEIAFKFEGFSQNQLRDNIADRLHQKGFQLQIERDEEEFSCLLLTGNYSVAWVISGSSYVMTKRGKASTRRSLRRLAQACATFHAAGGGLFIFGDNDPYVLHANAVLAAVDVGCRLDGNVDGNNFVLHKANTNPPATVESKRSGGCINNEDHPIMTGIATLFEGITICVPDPSDKFEEFFDVLAVGGYKHDSTERPVPLILASKDARRAASRGRIVVDGGFTKLWSNWKVGGTDRYVTNATAWLTAVDQELAISPKQEGIFSIPRKRVGAEVALPPSFEGWLQLNCP